MNKSIRYLMCPPTYYEVDYVINPWMKGNVHNSSIERAIQQWQSLYNVIKEIVTVDLVTPQKGVPDLVFTANAGVVRGSTVVLAHFYYPQRQPEEPYYKEWFESNGFHVYEFPRDIIHEGAGDALFDRAGDWLWAAYGIRSQSTAHPLLSKWLSIEVVSLRLVDERFYHLDTCFCPLTGGYLLYFPAAFDEESLRIIESRVPLEKRIPITEADAVKFACNAINIGNTIVMNEESKELEERLSNLGFTVITTPLSEFLKAGGSAKCLTLRLTEPVERGQAS